jgi:hypothetical protein
MRANRCRRPRVPTVRDVDLTDARAHPQLSRRPSTPRRPTHRTDPAPRASSIGTAASVSAGWSRAERTPRVVRGDAALLVRTHRRAAGVPEVRHRDIAAASCLGGRTRLPRDVRRPARRRPEEVRYGSGGRIRLRNGGWPALAATVTGIGVARAPAVVGPVRLTGAAERLAAALRQARTTARNRRKCVDPPRRAWSLHENGGPASETHPPAGIGFSSLPSTRRVRFGTTGSATTPPWCWPRPRMRRIVVNQRAACRSNERKPRLRHRRGAVRHSTRRTRNRHPGGQRLYWVARWRSPEVSAHRPPRRTTAW